MNIISRKSLSSMTSRHPVLLKCEYCHKHFILPKNQVLANIKKKRKNHKCNRGRCCSVECQYFMQKNGVKKYCTNCNTEIYMRNCDIKKHLYSNSFCSHSCSAIFNNAHKKYGTRKSKFEVWAEKQLKLLYPDIKILCNSKTAIDSELDIFIPSLSLAFEFNGILHYKPIYGIKKLNKIKKNDKLKKDCVENKR